MYKVIYTLFIHVPPESTGADISNIVNQAAFQAARAGEREVNMGHLEYAKEKILDGKHRLHQHSKHL